MSIEGYQPLPAVEIEQKNELTNSTSDGSRSYRSLSSGGREDSGLVSPNQYRKNCSVKMRFILVCPIVIILVIIAIILGLTLRPKKNTPNNLNIYENCKYSIIGSGWGGLYYTYRVSLSEDAIWNPKEICIFEVSKTRIGGRVYTYIPEWEDVIVDLGSSHHELGQELVSGVVHNILNKSTICYKSQIDSCNDTEVIGDPYGNNGGYGTVLESLLNLLYSHGLRPVFMDHELINIRNLNNNSHELQLTFSNGQTITSDKVLLNFAKTSLLRLQSNNLINTFATNQTLSALLSPKECISIKQYIRYDDAWWLTKLNYSYGINTTDDGLYPPLRDISYFDGPIKCQIEGGQYASQRIPGGNCWGALLSLYESACVAENVEWYENNYAYEIEKEKDVSILINKGDSRDELLTSVHQRLLTFHNQNFLDANIDPSSISLPTSTVISIWDSINYRWNYPSWHDLIDPETGLLTEDADFKIRNQIIIPVPGYDLFIANEAWSGSDGMAEGSLMLVERLLSHRFNFSKPAWISEPYWKNVIIPSLPPPQDCFLNIECPPSTQCLTSSCTNGTCKEDIHTNQTCDDGDPCTINDQCSNEGLCIGIPLICSGINICVNGICTPPTPPPLPTCSWTTSLGSFHLYWNWIDEDSIRIAFSLPGSAYIALGFGTSMSGADIILGWVNNDGSFNITDRYSYTTGTPQPDITLGGTHDLTNIWATRINSITTIWFTRKLNTSDTFDSIIHNDEITHIIYAWNNGNPGAVSYHNSNRQPVNVDMRGC